MEISEVLKSYRRDGYNFKYVNLRWLWIAISAVLCLYFINAEVTMKTEEYSELKTRFSNYVNRPVELSITPCAASILLGAKEEEKVSANLDQYYYLNPTVKDLSKFDSLILKKAGNQGWTLHLGESGNKAVLFNPDFLLVYLINVQKVTQDKVGSDVEMYFDYKPKFKDGKLFTSLTWAPKTFNIYLSHGFYLAFMSVMTFLLVPILGSVVFFFYPGFRRFTIHDFLSFGSGYYVRSDLSRELQKKTKYILRTGGSIYLVG